SGDAAAVAGTARLGGGDRPVGPQSQLRAVCPAAGRRDRRRRVRDPGVRGRDRRGVTRRLRHSGPEQRGANPRRLWRPQAHPATTTATIGNQPPAVNAGPDWVISTGGSVNLSATFTDTPSDTPWSYTITWGDGSVQSSTATASPIISSHAYATSGQYTLLVSVTDRRGLTGSDNAIVNVSDATPSQVLVGAGDI